MRILQATVSSESLTHESGERLSIGSVAAGMACCRADSADHCSAVAGLIAELLLGGQDGRWRSSRYGDGEAHLVTRHGELRLRRSIQGGQPALSLAPIGDRSPEAPPPGPADWQGIVPARVLGAVFFTAPRDARSLERLLSPDVAEAFNRLAAGRPRRGESNNPSGSHQTKTLLTQRDELVARIEATLSERRRESARLDQEIQRLEQRHAEHSGRAESLRRRVEGLARRVNDRGLRRRYAEVSRLAAEAEGRHAQDQWAPRVEELDEEVARWRATLAELERREAIVRSELARLRPDDTAPQLLLADQRASVAVASRLVADLEAEVARFARGGDSPVCLCADAHARLNPLVETLGRHVQELARLVAQQDDAQRVQDLLAEADQLDRSQSELRRQLDHLLERRQTLWRSTRARAQRDAVSPEALADPADEGPALERLSAELADAEAQLAGLDRSLRDAVQRRRRLLDDAPLDLWRRELDRVQTRLSQGADAGWADTESLRASDVLARLSDGDWTELRLAPGGRSVEARDRTGRVHGQRDLSASDRRLIAWALRLALADAAHAGGAAFTLVLDQPFADLDDRAAANLATCLDDYARRGRQVLVLSTDGEGVSRLRSLGAPITSLDGAAPDRTPAAPPVVRSVTREEVVTRPCLLDPDDPIERFPAPLSDRGEAFARARIRTVGDLLGADPSAVAEEMDAEGVTAELVALWQAHAALVAYTPGLDLRGAKRLVDCDVLSVEELAGADAARLADALRRRGADDAASRVEGWVAAARGSLARWRGSSWSDGWRRNGTERRDRIRENARRRRSSDRQDRPERRRRRESERHDARSRETEKQELRFYLCREDDIEAAPSIGPKRAEHLRAIGVRTVADLLEGDPEQIATRLDSRRVDAATVVAWQHQSNLMVSVPGLRGHDAQILVGCGFASAEEIAGMKPAELLEFVDPYCDSADGQRALRGSDRPDLEEVTEWVRGARQRRTVGAV